MGPGSCNWFTSLLKTRPLSWPTTRPPPAHQKNYARRHQVDEKIQHWRRLPLAERRRQHLEAVPRHPANSMAMEGEPVDEVWLRARLAPKIRNG